MRRFMTRPGRVKRLQYIFLIFLIIFSSIALFINYKNQELAEQLVIKQAQDRQLALAKAGASSIEWFFKTLESEIWDFSNISAIQSHDLAATRQIYQNFIQRYTSQPFLVITLLDEKGKILVAENKLGIKSSEGQDFSDRDYFQWARQPGNKGKIYISDPLVSRAGMTKGKFILTITSPVYLRNQFKGAVMLVSELDGFTSQFVDPLSVDSYSRTFIVDNKNTIIGADVKSGLNGKNIQDLARNAGFINVDEFVSQLSSMESQMEGTTEWVGKYSNKPDMHDLIAYKKFSIGDRQWTVVITTPKDTVISILTPFLPFQAVSVILIVACTFLAGVLFILTRNTAQLHGFKKALKLFQSS